MIAAVATIGEAHELPKLADDLLADGHVPWLLCNGEPGPFLRELRWPTLFVPGLGLYEVWNFALRAARHAGEETVAILNDDIVLGPRALSRAAALMDEDKSVAVCGLDYTTRKSCPAPSLRYVRGSFRHGGINGCAFVLRPRSVPDFDERYDWWYGDDDMFLSVEEQGKKLAIADGCWVAHRGEATAVGHPWTSEAKLEDHKKFKRKWGDV